MLLVAEYDYDTDIAVQRQESLKIGIQQGIEQGRSLGLAEGTRQKALETARILKQLGDSITKIMQVTGLSKADVEAIS